MANQSFPPRDADFNTYVSTVVPYLGDATNKTRLGVSDAHKAELTRLLSDWNTYYPQSQDANTRTKTATDYKNQIREDLTNTLRLTYDDIPQSALTPEDRNTLRLPERAKPTAAPIPTTAPEGRVDASQRLQHTIHFHNAGTDTSRAKPKGVRGCQIWYAEKADAAMAELTFLATDTKSPYVVHWTTEEATKNIYYWLRWENTRGEVGPWGEVVMATIGA